MTKIYDEGPPHDRKTNETEALSKTQITQIFFFFVKSKIEHKRKKNI